MKKLFSLALVLVMLLSLSVTAFAAEITGDSGSVVVTYGVDDAYIVTIPASIALSADEDSTIGISAADVVIGYGELLTVSVGSSNYDAENSKWYLVDAENPENKLEYSVKNGETAVAGGDAVLTVAAGNTGGGEVTLTTRLVDTAAFSGTYKDTITFTVSVQEIGGGSEDEDKAGLYTLYLKNSDGDYYNTTPLFGTDGNVSPVYQTAGTTISVVAGYTTGELPDNVTVGLAAYGLAVDGWEQVGDVSAETVYTENDNPYTFNAETGILADGDGNAIATISDDMKTITINSVVDNLIVDVYLLKDGQRIESTGSSMDTDKLFNSKYFVVSATWDD